MEKQNIFGLKAAQLDKSIYRILPVKYLYPIFDQKKNTLMRTKVWGDPFENFMLRSKFKLPTGELATVGFRDDFFGQCWSRRSQSEALWLLYSKKKDSVRIRTTPRKLFGSLCKALGDWAHTTCFLGKVDYFSKRGLARHARAIFRNIGTPRAHDFAETFLFKRRAFVHESEVRLLYFSHNDIAGDFFTYDVDPTDIVNDIRLDPRLTDAEAATLAKKIKRRTKFTGSIKRSDLYEGPPAIVLKMGLDRT